jgi:plastocyanin
VNRDDVAHTVTGVRNTFGDYNELLKDDTFAHTFEAEGVFPYFCVVHPSMVGAVVVGAMEARTTLHQPPFSQPLTTRAQA